MRMWFVTTFINKILLSDQEIIILFKYNNKIRRLTIREAFLMMGFSEQDYERMHQLGFSYRQENKLIGNAIVVNVLYEIFRAMFIGSWKLRRC